MEPLQLQSFYKSVTSWPTGAKAESEFSAIAEKVARLIGCPLAAIYSIQDETPRLGLKIMPVSGGEAPQPAFVEDFLRRHFRSAAASENGFARQIQIGPESAGGFGSARSLMIATITGDGIRSAVTPRETRAAPDAGYLIVGSEKSLGAKEEILVLSAAERLSGLARASRLEYQIQLRNQFLSIASHELKTPLTSIYGVLQLQERMQRLKHDKAEATLPGDPRRSYLKILLRQVERLNELIDGLLDVSRIQNNRFMVEPTESDVASLLRDTIQGRLQVISEEAGVKLQVEAPERLSAWVDPVRMEEVITNLVMNAIRFSPEGGVVWIKLKDEGAAFRLTVRDQGPGVPPEDRERLFQPFERAQRTSRLGGLGLGLFISRQIALLHGGNVSLVESVPGKGNVIEAHFPRRNISVISA